MASGTPHVGVMYPGNMGVAIAAAIAQSGAQVKWPSSGRSQQTIDRAEAAGLESVASLDEMLGAVSVVVSICPPDSALDVAQSVADVGFSGMYLDANAVSPTLMNDIAQAVSKGGNVEVVDGSILGLPPTTSGTTTLYLSGSSANEAAGLFAKSLFGTVVLGDEIGKASAMKMAYAGYTKASYALASCCVALAQEFGIADELFAEWNALEPGLGDRVKGRMQEFGPKAWRFIGEMELVAETFDSVGLPPTFHQAARDVFERWAPYKGTDDPAVEALVESLVNPT